MRAKLQKPRSRFYVGLFLVAIGFVFLQTPPVDGVMSLTIAPALLLAGYLVLVPLGLRPSRRTHTVDERGSDELGHPLSDYGGAAIVFLGTLLVYWITLWPGPGWWDSSAYAATSYTLGVTGPPGSIVLQLTGRFFGFLAFIASPAIRINLMSACATASAVTILYFTLIGIFRLLPLQRRSATVSVPAAIVGSLTLAFAFSVWQHATFTNPYALSLLTGALLFYAAVRWWGAADRDGGDNYLLLAAMLFGLDLSVHRSNLLLTPAFLALVLIRKPGVLLDVRLWLGSIVMFAIGLSLQLAIMFRAQLSPEINLGNPDELKSLWSYLTMSQYGIKTFGSDLLQRKGPLWDYQIKDMYLRYLGWNFVGVSADGSSVGWRFPFGLPALAALCGLTYLALRRWKLALWSAIAFLCAAGLAVFYLNIPANFFREMDRHFLVSFAIIGAWAGIGVFAVLDAVRGWWRRRPVRAPVIAGLLLMVFIPGGQVLGNYLRCDMSQNYAPMTYGRNLLETCEPHALLITTGDNDTFTLWYLQMIERVRPDVTVLNFPLLNTPWYLRTLRQYHPDLPSTLSDSAVMALTPVESSIDTVRISTFDDSETIVFALRPSYGAYLLVADRVLLDMLATNRFERPVYFTTGHGPRLPLGLGDLARLDGLAWRVVPNDRDRRSTAALEENLIFRYRFDGFDRGPLADRTTRQMMTMLTSPFSFLVSELRAQNRDALVEDVIARYRTIWSDGPELSWSTDSAGTS